MSSADLTHSSAKRARFTSGMLLPPLVVVILLWLPFGFAMTGLIEEWDLLGLFAVHGTFFYTHLDGPLAPHALRPLMPFSFALAHTLSPDSFVGWHVLTMAALVLKGVAMSWLAWRATGSRAAGVLAGVLTLLYPADTMQLSFRSIHINVSGAVALCASVVALHAFDSARRAASIALGLAAAGLFLSAGLMYEASFTLLAMPLAVLFVRHGLPRGWTAKQWVVAGLWLAAPLVYGAYALWISARISSYQGAVTGQGSALRYALSIWPDLFNIGAVRALAGGWLDAARMTARTFASHVYLGAAALGLIAVCLVALGRGRADPLAADAAPRSSTGMLLKLLFVGLVSMLMGYLPYITSAVHMAISQRTYLWATPGAALAWVSILLLLARIAQPLGAAAAAVLIIIGLGAQLFQFHHYVELSERQRSLLRAIVENVDGSAPDKKVLVLDGTSQMGHTWMFHEEELRFMLSYLFGRAMGSAEVCRLPSMEWQRRDSFGRPGRCSEDPQGWAFTSALAAGGPGTAVVEPKRPIRHAGAQLVLAPIAANGSPVLQPGLEAHRERLRHGQDTLARRYRAVLSNPTRGWIAPMFKDQFPSDSFRFDFGDWWSLEVVPHGSGWREAEWTGKGLRHASRSWVTSDSASLYVPLKPAEGPYVLKGWFYTFANGAVREAMRAHVNGRALALGWTPDGHFAAIVPPGVLTAGRNELVLSAPTDPAYFGLSASIDWVSLEPLSTSP
ncbi:conserved membrane hypothetical protein [Burkholderiales bacterium 8X]|nr:conserved membrane hypothetical protein [Burkholderiales bacterium 8X]